MANRRRKKNRKLKKAKTKAWNDEQTIKAELKKSNLLNKVRSVQSEAQADPYGVNIGFQTQSQEALKLRREEVKAEKEASDTAKVGAAAETSEAKTEKSSWGKIKDFVLSEKSGPSSRADPSSNQAGIVLFVTLPLFLFWTIGNLILSMIGLEAQGLALYNTFWEGPGRVYTSMLFVALSIVFIYHNRGWMIAGIWFLWQTVYNASLPPPNAFYLISVIWIVLYGLVFWGNLSNFRQNIREELFGAIPILIFYLDIGLLAFLTKEYGWTVIDLLKTMILYFPWWPYFALINIKSKNTFMQLFKGLGILWIFIIIMTGVGQAAFSDQGAVISIGDIRQSQEDIVAQYGKATAGPGEKAYSQILCSFTYSTNPTKITECTINEESKIICAKFFPKKIGDDYDNCLKEKQAQLSGKSATGQTDEDIKDFTKITFKKPDYFNKQMQKTDLLPLVYLINVDSPLKPVNLDLSCYFKPSDTSDISGAKLLKGSIEPKSLSFEKGKNQEAILCKPPQLDSGSYYVVFEAWGKDFSTLSRLQRFIIGDDIKKSDKERAALLSREQLGSSVPSKAPDEPGVFSLLVGSPPQYPLLDSRSQHTLIANVENKADGIFTTVNNIEIELIKGVTPTDNCLTKFNLVGNKLIAKHDLLFRLNFSNVKKGDKAFGVNCKLNFAPELKIGDKDSERVEFRSKIDYAYKLKKEERFSVSS